MGNITDGVVGDATLQGMIEEFLVDVGVYDGGLPRSPVPDAEDCPQTDSSAGVMLLKKTRGHPHFI